MSHVRSADTRASVNNSKAELDRILTRYGCTRSGSDMDREAKRITVWFTVPDHKLGKGEFVPVRIEVSLRDVKARLQARKREVPDEQVERVAWRHIVFLVEAGLVAADAGVKKVSEFFLADTVVRDQTGREIRLIRAMEQQNPQWRGLLTAGVSE